MAAKPTVKTGGAKRRPASRPKPDGKSFKVTLNHYADTKGTRRYEEEGEPGDVKLKTIYLKKPVAEELGNPDAITVTVEAA